MPINDVIDELVATCDGNLRGAVKALLLVNECLENELRYFHALAPHLVLREDAVH
jgi:hypothetical protein